MGQSTSNRNDLQPDGDAAPGEDEFDRDEAAAGPWPAEEPMAPAASPLRVSASPAPEGGAAEPARGDQKGSSRSDRRRDPAPLPRRPSPFQKQRDRVQNTWLSKLSKFAPDAMWYAKRVGPPYYRGRKTKVGVFPKPFMGPVSPELIAGQMGGGLISVTLDDPASDEAEWYGPIEIMWDDVSERGLEPRDHGDGAASEGSTPRAQESPNDEVTIFDPQLGMIKRRRADVERQFARSRDDLVIEELRRAQAEQQELLRTLLERLAPEARSEARESQKSPMEELLRLERERLEADKALKSEELKFLREKLENDRVEAERQRKHDLEVAEKRFEAEKERFANERASLEERLDQERRLAESKIEKAHTTMLEMVNNKTNPLEHVSTLLSTFHEVQELLGGPAPAGASADGGGPKRPKTVSELVVDKLVSAADRIFPSVEPILQHAVRSYLDRSVREVAGGALPPPAAPAPALPAPAEARPEGRAQPPREQAREPVAEFDWGGAVGSAVADLDDGMNRNLPPRAVWDNIRATVAPVAEQLRAYTSVDQLAAELETLASAPALSAHADAIRTVARKAAGPNRAWAEQFLDVIRGGKAASAGGGRA